MEFIKKRVRSRILMLLGLVGVEILLFGLIGVLVAQSGEGAIIFAAFLFLILILMCIAIAIPVVFAIIRNNRIIKSFSPQEQTMFDQEFEQGAVVNKYVAASASLVMIQMKLIPVRDIVWIYDQLGEGIENAKNIVIVNRKKKSQIVQLGKMAGSGAVRKFIKVITDSKPGIIIGNTKENRDMYRRDFISMCMMADKVK